MEAKKKKTKAKTTTKKTTTKKPVVSKKKTTVKKVANKRTTSKKKSHSVAFTLIELLAVIIILGVLMLVAIPSVTSYIGNSRKSAYITTSKKLVDGAIARVNGGDFDIYDTETTYYIPYSLIATETGARSPYGDFKNAYVVVTYNGDSFEYYWTSTDNTKMGIKLIDADLLDNDKVVPNIDNVEPNIAICGKERIVLFVDSVNMQEIDSTAGCYNVDSGEIAENKLIQVVNQATEGTLSVGDEILIGNREGFNVVSTDSEKTVLLAKYNLLVGYQVEYVNNYGYRLVGQIPTSTPGYGYQSEATRNKGYGVVPFSGKNYWQSTTNPNYFNPNYPDARNESIYTKSMSTVAPVVSEYTNAYNYTQPNAAQNDYTIAYYVEPYIEKIRAMGVQVFDGGLLSNNQAGSLGCWGNSSCSYYQNTWLTNTAFWVASVAWEGSSSYQSCIKYIDKNHSYSYSGYEGATSYGVRPTITIRTADIELLGHDYFENLPPPLPR